MIASLLLALVLGQPAEAHTGKSGTTVFVTGMTKLAPVVTNPSLTIVDRDQSLDLIPGPVSSGFWSFAIARPDVQILPTQTLRINFPAGWYNGAFALSLPVTNYAGRNEFAVGMPKMGLGVNISTLTNPAAVFVAPRNFASHLQKWDGFCLATDASGYPTSLRGTTTHATFLSSSQGNGVDSLGTPGYAGIWTVQWDSPNGQTQCAIQSASPAWVVTAQPDLSSPGVAGIGATAAFQVKPAEGTVKAPNNRPSLWLTVTDASSKPAMSNLAIFPPGNPIDRSDPLAPEQWLMDSLTVGMGHGPSTLRWMDSCAPSGGRTNAVDPTDIQTVSGLTWLGHSDRTVVANVTSLRPLDLTVSPTLDTIYGPRPMWSKFILDSGNCWLAEAVTDQPHGLRTGQTVVIRSPTTTPMTITAGPYTWTGTVFQSLCFVTSPTTFCVRGFALTLPQAGPTDITAMDTPGATVTMTVAIRQLVPYELAAATTSKFPGSIHWVNIPHAATDATVDYIAQVTLANLATGHRVIPEYSNEVWNFGFDQWGYVVAMNRLLAPDQTMATRIMYQAQRSAEIVARWKAIWGAAGRADDVLMVLAGQSGGMQNVLTWAAANGIAADVLAVAPYRSLPAAWEPLIATWTLPQCHDLMRHFLTLDGGSLATWAAVSKDFNAYEKAIGRRCLRYTYEGGVMHVVKDLAKATDFFNHADMADTERTAYWTAQVNGMDIFTHYTHTYSIKSNNGNSFGLFSYPGQLPGDGLSNQPMGTTGIFPSTAQSVRGKAWRDWQRDYLIGRTDPTSQPAPQ